MMKHQSLADYDMREIGVCKQSLAQVMLDLRAF